MSDRDLVVLGVGMHPWGKWGRDFTEYGMVAARAALKDAGIEWKDVQYVAGADTSAMDIPALLQVQHSPRKWAGLVLAFRPVMRRVRVVRCLFRRHGPRFLRAFAMWQW